MSFESVIVIGGGLAGLSSAVALAESGLRIRLLEKRPHLGGRATSYFLPDGSHVDNCQHVTLGCCTNLADFFRRVGAEGKIRYYDRLYFMDSGGRRFRIAPSLLPPPFHMAPSFLCFSALSFADKRAISRALLDIARHGGHSSNAGGISMLDWLRRSNQTPGAIERFWRIVLVSALDEELARSDARYGIDVFWKAFLATRAGFQVGIPIVPLSQLYDGCRPAIESRGGEVRSRTGVREIRLEDNRVACVVLEDGSELECDACIVAVPHERLLELLPASFVEHEPSFLALRRLRNSPITGVHFWFDRKVMNEPFFTLLGHTVQWVFNKSLLTAQRGWNGSRAAVAALQDAPDSASAAREGQYLQLVISASYDLVPRSRQDIIDLCLRELQDVLPTTRQAQLLKATVIKEVAATFSPEPGSDQWRPESHTPIPNLFLAGDWTRTGWPATMEGAVRSGYLAAEAILEMVGRPRKLLHPDLPPEGFCRLLRRDQFPRGDGRN